MTAAAPALEFEGVCKRFGGVQALSDVSFAVPTGRVVGLVGQNGAGKSTLMNVLGGVVSPDAGAMRLGGAPYAPRDPAAAARTGVAFIHQELNLFPNLSVADNLFVGDPGFWLDRGAAHRRAAELLAAVELAVAPDMPVERLAPGERQLVEIARALSADARVVIFDEPTTLLAARETVRLFRLIGRLRDEGRAVLFISHALGDVLRLADEVVVMRDGRVADAGPRERFTVPSLVARMVGREMARVFPPRTAPPRDGATLEVRGLTQPGVARDISFTLHAGEVLGVFGLMGSGRTELARMLFGLAPYARGEVLVGGAPLRVGAPREAIARGVAFVTEDRRDEGLLLDAPVLENAALAFLSRFARGPFRVVDRARLRAEVGRVAGELGVRCDALDGQPVKSLSGGNQQKVVLARWLLSPPAVLLLDEPTRGIDVGAKHEVYTIIDRLAAKGSGVLMISSEVEELTGMCDRILVMHAGELRAEFVGPAFEEERILGAAFGESDDGEADVPIGSALHG